MVIQLYRDPIFEKGVSIQQCAPSENKSGTDTESLLTSRFVNCQTEPERRPW